MTRIDWNEAGRQGLIERINTEILHPLGLAMFRTPEDGASPGLLIAEDGRWEYAQGTLGILPTVTAERDALQLRLNVTDQQVDDLQVEVKRLKTIAYATQGAGVVELLEQISQLQGENAALCQAVKHSAMRIKELDLLFGRYLLGMRSAVIELEHGQGAEAAMKWIVNGLAGPGEFAPDDATDAQAYFDREIEAVDAGMAEVCAFFHPTLKEVTP